MEFTRYEIVVGFLVLRARVLRLFLHALKFNPAIRAYLHQEVVWRKSGVVASSKARTTGLLVDVRLPPECWSWAGQWMVYRHNHPVLDIPIDKRLPNFRDEAPLVFVGYESCKDSSNLHGDHSHASFDQQIAGKQEDCF